MTQETVYYFQAAMPIIAFAASIVAGVGVYAAFKQLKANHDWNRRNAAMVEVMKTREQVIKALEKIDKHLKYTERDKNSPFSIDEIHAEICETKNGKLELTENGTELKRNIKIVLAQYEYLATGIQNKVFDEKTVADIVEGPMIRAFELFKPYIKHLRELHKSKEIYIELEKVVDRWEKTKKGAESSERKPTA